MYPTGLFTAVSLLFRRLRLIVNREDDVLRPVVFHRNHEVGSLGQGNSQVAGQGSTGHGGTGNPSILPLRKLEVAEVAGYDRLVCASNHLGFQVELPHGLVESKWQQVDRFS